MTFRRGAPITAPDDLWTNNASTGCKGAALPTGDHYEIDRVDDADFIAATFVDELGDSLGVRVIVADDGAWERVHLLDVTTGRPCQQGYELVDGDLISLCTVPAPLSLSPAYEAAECDGAPLLQLYDDGTCDLPSVASDYENWWELGPRYEGDAWEKSSDECTPYPELQLATSLFERGAPVDPPVFASYERVPVPADEGDRLQPYGIDISGTKTLLSRVETAWYDAVLDAPCSAVALAEGGWICAHATMQHAPTDWGDAECATTPLTWKETNHVPPIVVRVQDDGCGPTAQDAQAVFGDWEGDVFSVDRRTGECVPSGSARPGEFLRLGNFVQLAELPTLVVESTE